MRLPQVIDDTNPATVDHTGNRTTPADGRLVPDYTKLRFRVRSIAVSPDTSLSESKRFVPSGRREYVTLTTTLCCGGAGLELATPAAPVRWPTTLIPVLALPVIGVFGLLLEWQRRETMVAVVPKALRGTSIVQAFWPGGLALCVRTGHSSDAPGQGRAHG